MRARARAHTHTHTHTHARVRVKNIEIRRFIYMYRNQFIELHDNINPTHI